MYGVKGERLKRTRRRITAKVHKSLSGGLLHVKSFVLADNF